MKLKYLLIFNILLFTKAQAQAPIRDGVAKGIRITFLASKGPSNILWVKDKADPDPNKFAAKALTQLPYYRTMPEDAVGKAFYKVFSKSRIEDLLPELNMSFQIYYNGQGRIKYIYYLMRKHTVITPAELEKLETALRTDVILDVPHEYRDNDNI